MSEFTGTRCAVLWAGKELMLAEQLVHTSEHSTRKLLGAAHDNSSFSFGHLDFTKHDHIRK